MNIGKSYIQLNKLYICLRNIILQFAFWIITKLTRISDKKSIACRPYLWFNFLYGIILKILNKFVSTLALSYSCHFSMTETYYCPFRLHKHFCLLTCLGKLDRRFQDCEFGISYNLILPVSDNFWNFVRFDKLYYRVDLHGISVIFYLFQFLFSWIAKDIMCLDVLVILFLLSSIFKKIT